MDKWLMSFPQQSYAFTLLRKCSRNCSYSWKPVRVYVEHNTIHRVLDASNSSDLDVTEDLPTVISLFELILEAIKEQQVNPTRILKVEYHEIYGYPVSILTGSPHGKVGGMGVSIYDVVAK